MRILAVDPGTKRVGLAVSDPTGTIATAVATLAASPVDTLPARIAAAAREHDAERILIGLPLRMDGRRGPEAAAAERLASDVRQAARLPVETIDERLTSVAAERSLIEGGVRRDKRRASVDRVAAVLLLQGYLDRKRSSNRAG